MIEDFIEDEPIFHKNNNKYEYQKPAFPVPANTKSHKSGLTKLQYAKIELTKIFPDKPIGEITERAKQILDNEEQ